MKVYEALAAGFAREGVGVVYGLMGDANMKWLNAISASGIQVVNVRHEGAGLAMADGEARASGRVGVCTTTSGPGTSQLATTMLVASRARTPLVAFCGDVERGATDEPQYLDQKRFAEATEAGFVRLERGEDALRVVSDAFLLATSESRPVILSAPLDVQNLEVDLDSDDYVPARERRDPWPLAPHAAAIAAAAALIEESERIIIVAGRGAADAEPEIARLADKTGALLATSLLAKGFAADDPFNIGIVGLYATRTAIQLCQEADLVIGIGASLNTYTTEQGYLFPDAAFILADTKSDPVLWDGRAPDAVLRADAALAAEALLAAVSERSGRQGFRTDETRALIADADDDRSPVELDEGTVDPREVCRSVDRLVPGDFGLVLGSGHQTRFPTMILRRPRPFVIAQHHFGCIGQALTTGIGASFARGKAPVFTLEGDAGFMMHLAEFDTAVRYGVPILVIVMNDEAIGAEYQKSKATGLDESLTLIPAPDLGLVARALGGDGKLARSIAEVEAGLADFISAPRPYVLDVRISRTVLSIPYRRLWNGEDV
ncbi:thiamine pyrophosphate-binding protein [Gryllotalpicola protaetiae]|uniref:Thiamine pyrophosphate-binding protein n=1 Tax=Gryllotalpicola protaetiae TaxID=2419771 RepID=A0A387BLB5_9MICO|nr:thiamine pyrophosphate-binding protein [Gryllotalpicola protaetiae]AYG03152.1 thiamine pyrophosphate-binding protein [Gryllotalpicola protaetiae]